MKPKPEFHRLAKQHNVDIRTVRRWRKSGAPLNDPKSMASWLAGRRVAPTGGPRKTAPPSPRKLRSAPPPRPKPEAIGEPGAPAALRRLEKAEVAAYARLEAALRSGNPLEVKDARSGYLKTTEALRKTDITVAEHRRTSGELVARGAVEKYLETFAHWWAVAITQACGFLAVRLNPADPSEAVPILESGMLSTVLASLASFQAALSTCPTSFPAWLVAAFASGATGSIKDGTANLARQTEFLRAITAAACGDHGPLDGLLARTNEQRL